MRRGTVKLPKEFRALVQQLCQQGWELKPGQHPRLIPPSGTGVVSLSSTPGDRRAYLNARAKARQLGGNV